MEGFALPISLLVGTACNPPGWRPGLRSLCSLHAADLLHGRQWINITCIIITHSMSHCTRVVQAGVLSSGSRQVETTPPSKFVYFGTNFNGTYGGYHPSYPTQAASAAKFWDEFDLREATLVESPYQLGPLLAKLKRGEPISVVALGSSVTADYGGCFNRGNLDVVRAHVKLLPMTHMMGKCSYVRDVSSIR